MNLSTNKYNDIRWYSQKIEDIFKHLNSSNNGLDEKNITELQKKHGFNEIINVKKESIIQLLLEQFKSLLIIILIVASIVSFSIGQSIEAIAIIVIVILAGVLGFVQEYRASKAIESLQQMAAPHATVIRNGNKKVVYARELVPGDIIILNTGDKVPADCRIIESYNLKTDEASLTGESTPCEKHNFELADTNIALGDRHNMLFMGTSILYGRGKAIVVSTGMNTEFGKIATLLQNTENRKTPLQVNLNQLGKNLGIYAIIIAFLMSLIGFLKGHEVVEMFIWGVAIAVAIIPEALPAVVTISIALGVRRMVKRRALIRKLPAVETLGATNVICTDKTGTLTKDEMTVRKIFALGQVLEITGAGYLPEGEFYLENAKINFDNNNKKLLKFISYGVLCTDSSLVNENGKYKIIGDPTEGAIIVAAKKAGIDIEKLKNDFVRVHEIPFSSETKKMTTIHRLEDDRYLIICKGAPEILLQVSKKYELINEIIPLDTNIKQDIEFTSNEFAKNALRVLAVCYKIVDNYINEDIENDLIFLGMFGMIDPPRDEVKDAIKICENAGIKPIMITGDHEITAVAVAKELNILKVNQRSISGLKLESLTDEEFEEVVDETVVYARISPSHKLKIVNALMKRGNIVAMTGDGVNDAPALKKADIGVAMGIKGTEVSREAADMILTDDNFSSIVAAIEEGRGIFQNIKKYLVYLLGGNLGTVLALVISLLAGLPIPLQAVQILFINFLMDGLIAISLGVEPAENYLMNKKPRNVNEGILDKKTLYFIGISGFIIGLVTIGTFVLATNNGYGVNKAETIFFISLIFARIFNGLACRSLENSIFSISIFKNLPLLYSILTSLIFTILVVQVPILQKAFHNDSLIPNDWIFAITAGIIVLFTLELYKKIIRTKNKTNIKNI